MDPRTGPLFAGIAGVHLDGPEFTLGHGVQLTSTFAHLMAPFLMAFAPAQEGRPHPGPWSTVAGGLSFDIYVQLSVPTDFSMPEWFDRLNTIWWITALLRLHTALPIQVPVVADRPFAEIPGSGQSVAAIASEIAPRTSRRSAQEPATISPETLTWLRSAWLRAGRLMHREPHLNEAFQAFDQAGAIRTSSVALLVLWGALEHLFSPAKQELKFRVSSYIAAFLEPFGSGRRALQREVASLYDSRSRAAHGAGVEEDEAYESTVALFRRILLRVIADDTLPDRHALDDLVFGQGGEA